MTRTAVSQAYYKWVLGACVLCTILGIGATFLFKDDPMLSVTEPVKHQIARQMAETAATQKPHAFR